MKKRMLVSICCLFRLVLIFALAAKHSPEPLLIAVCKSRPSRQCPGTKALPRNSVLTATYPLTQQKLDKAKKDGKAAFARPTKLAVPGVGSFYRIAHLHRFRPPATGPDVATALRSIHAAENRQQGGTCPGDGSAGPLVICWCSPC